MHRRGYITGKKIQVTPLGLAVVDALSHSCPQILDEELTRRIEMEMEFIRTGELEEEKVLEHGKEILREILDAFRKREDQIGRELRESLMETREKQNLLGKCSACGGDLKIIRLPTGSVFVGCSGYPKCRMSYPLPQRGKIVPLGKVCEKCGTPMVRVFRARSRPFDMCLEPKCETKKEWGKKRADVKSSKKKDSE